jgi:hypothetical protein
MYRSHFLIVALSIALLAGCSSMPETAPQNAQAGATLAERAGAWMMPGAAKVKSLLYASDWYHNKVYVYDYQTHEQVGTLTGFDEPMGECEDAKGDVWITNREGEEVVEYAHGGTSPLTTLQTNGYSNGCSFSPHGDLAVTNLYTASGPGNIQVFKNASGTPVEYANPSDCYYISPAGYDDKGNLYAEVTNPSSGGVCELAAGAKTLKAISFNHTINADGSVMWDGRHITLTDALYASGETAIYQARPSSRGLVLVGTTVLEAAGCNGADMYQPFIVGSTNTPVDRGRAKTVIASEVLCSGEPIAFWHYPGGGQPHRMLDGAGAVLYPSVSFAR